MSDAAGERFGPRPPLLHRVTRGQWLAIDVAVAVAALVAGSHVAAHSTAGPVVGGPIVTVGVSGVLLVATVGAALAIAIRRPLPRVALGVMAACVAVGATQGFAAPAPLIVVPMYQVATTRDRRESLSWLAIVCAAVLAGAAVGLHRNHPGAGSSFGALVAVAAWFIGDSVRVRRVYVAGLAEQAAQRQREAIERAQRSVAEERLQIARELHDVVAHSLSVIAVQSGVGRHVIDANPKEAKQALAAVEATSRGALEELRHMLGVLRRDDGDPAALAPAPGVGRLGELVDQVRAAGVPVDLRLDSRALGTLSPGAELSVYRVVQEALTNVVKHAGPATVVVEVRDEPGTLVIEVTDDGRGTVPVPVGGGEPGPVAHHGIVGMRERVALFGGTLRAGPQTEGGFQVHARMALDRASR